MSHVLVSPLNWGLGHATRDIPIIRTLLAHGHDVTIAACGNALAVLAREFPACRTIEYPDYPVAFSAGRFFIPRFCASVPALLRGMAQEHATLEKILSRGRYDLVISDNRLGVYSDRVPSLFVTHQLRYHMPVLYWPAGVLAIPVNRFVHEKFGRIIVPDNPPGPTALAGKLSRAQTGAAQERVFYAGILSGARQIACTRDLECLILISGPEPQRTIFEGIVQKNLAKAGGSGTVLRGNPRASGAVTRIGDWEWKSYVSTEEKAELMNRAQTIVCRSGYTTLMELAELGKTKALLVPTPGQTEQEYLAEYCEEQNWFCWTGQAEFDPAPDPVRYRKFRGFPREIPKTAENTKRLYNDLLAGYLE
jgi:UDP-N-acetylglucosamine:LPS N-acetylglucosamine transferase